ncbi:MAG: glycerol-3-phosphate dehydrogenase [Pseudomonadales bacterium]|nr:glycerol-3-phosphate dehydrogenase [Pseudomonadales bacterium]
MDSTEYDHDLLVIGGGVNGAGIAADAAGRGLNVVLCEKADLASATSSWSSKLIHGGLRYLEQYQFGLVAKSLRERDVLTESARHIIRPIPFQIPLLDNSRSGMLIRMGLFVYDNLVKRVHYKGSRSVKFGSDSPLNSSIKRGFEYWDGQVDDSRLVILNARQAEKHSAEILTRTECIALKPLSTSATSNASGWQVTMFDHVNQVEIQRTCKVVVNASGPWVSSLYEKLQQKPAPHDLRLVKGSHIVVPKLHDGDNAFLMQHHDGRVIFVIPYLQDYSLIGTTDEEFSGDLDEPGISKEETEYLIAITNLYFKGTLHRDDIVHTYSGVRPLIDEQGKSASKVSRDYRLVLEKEPAPILSVYGGKVTTYRVLAEQVMSQLGQFFPGMKGAWTKRAVLPGGDFELAETLYQELASKYGWLGPDLISRWLNTYGTLSFDILQNSRSMGDLGVRFGANLYQKEVDYLRRNEWAHTAADILWRRTKLGYLFSKKEEQSLDNYLQQAPKIK